MSASIRINSRDFAAGTAITIGRDETCDVTLDDPTVSRVHASVELIDDVWIFKDSSSNGSYQNGTRISILRITEPVTIIAGTQGSLLAFEPTIKTASEPVSDELGRMTIVHEARSGPLTIGRDETCSIVLPDLRASRKHATLRQTSSGSFELQDEGSHNGTFVNGSRIDRATLTDGDVVTIGAHIFRFAAGKLIEFEDKGGAWLQASGLVVTTDDGKKILDGIGFSLEPGTLLAVVGPSGAGKSTLLNALTGFRPANEGRVSYGGRDVYESFEEIRTRTGFVPQEDILHPQLTVSRALGYAAELRFPPDVTPESRAERVKDVMQELGVTERANISVEKLSGGQRKRTSIGLELLTEPSLLYLDEPTSGLDPGNEAHVMDLLRELADGGRIVVVVTHSVQSLDICDRVLYMAPGGHTAYFGPPKEALDYFKGFGLHSHPEIFRALDEHRERDWAGLFKSNQRYDTYVLKTLTLSAVRKAYRGEQPLPPKSPVPWRKQFGVLTRRAIAVLRADRKNLLLLGIQAPAFGVLFTLLVPTEALSTRFGLQGAILLWLIVVGCIWLGMSNAIREIGREAAIYRRERSVGLSTTAYLGSKILVFGVITIIQANILALIALAKQPVPPIDQVGIFAALKMPPPNTGSVLPSSLLELLLAFTLAALASMALGFLVSALMKTVDRAMSMFPLLLIAQIVVSMPLLPQKGVLNAVSEVLPAKWGNDAVSSTVSMNELRLPYYTAILTGGTFVFGSATANKIAIKPFRAEWNHDARSWTIDASAIVVLFIIPLLATYFVLRRRDKAMLGAARAP
ncbi:MAG: FHA domain-containing protein [Actinomycetota bacterium]